LPNPPDGSVLAAWGIAGLATAGVIARPFRLPEAIWAVAGAIALVAFGLLPWIDAFSGVRKGLDVYLFLAGMMLIAEVARQEGVFDWLAALAVEYARGSPRRLFALVYSVGTVVTVLLSNDATAVVLTPAVYAATRAAGATPLPYLFVCAFIANAASFVLPISNPANLVVFGAHMPHLAAWLAQFGLPSAVSIGVTYLALRMTQRRALDQDKIAREFPRPLLTYGGRLTVCGIGAVAVVLLCCSALNVSLGLPTFLCGVVTTTIVLALNRQSPWPVISGVSWGVLPLVAGLFVLVEALDHTGVIDTLGGILHAAVVNSMTAATWGAGLIVGFASNLMNNLPVGLIVGSVVAANRLPTQVIGAMLVGVDLGPNLSVTGSLATILWLVVLRREGLEVGTWAFSRLGIIVMLPALILSIAAMTLLASLV
jgi:arsenical pump membrane protein